MPRIRTIKPDFFSNEEIGKLPVEARLLFIGLWTLADCQGRLQDRPMRISAQLFPYDSWDTDALLSNLGEAHLIIRYEVENQKCIQITNFTKHQHPHPKELPYDLPAPAVEKHGKPGNSTASREKVMTSRVDSHVLTMDSLTMDSLSPTPLPAEEGGTNSPQETKGAKTTGERESKSRFSLKECEQYAASLKSIKTPKAYGKTIWRSAEADEEIAEFLGNTGKSMKKQPDRPVDVAEIQRIAAEFDKAQMHEIADQLRASIEPGGAK